MDFGSFNSLFDNRLRHSREIFKTNNDNNDVDHHLKMDKLNSCGSLPFYFALPLSHFLSLSLEKLMVKQLCTQEDIHLNKIIKYQFIFGLAEAYAMDSQNTI